jgi:hypothetical protein
VYQKVPTLLLLLNALVKKDERGGQGRISTSVLHQSAIRNHAMNTHCLHMSAFLTLCLVLSTQWQNQAMTLHQVLREAW